MYPGYAGEILPRARRLTPVRGLLYACISLGRAGKPWAARAPVAGTGIAPSEGVLVPIGRLVALSGAAARVRCILPVLEVAGR